MGISDITSSFRSYPIAWISGLLSLGLFLYLYFTMDSLSEYQQRVDELEHEVGVLKTNFKEGSEIEDDLETFKEAFSEVRANLLDRNQIARNNGLFYDMAQPHSIQMLSVSQKATISENTNAPKGDIFTLKHFSVIPFEMRFVGLLNDILGFLYSLDTSDIFVSVRSFDLTLAENRDPGYMMMNLELNVMGKPLKEEEADE